MKIAHLPSNKATKRIRYRIEWAAALSGVSVSLSNC
jgi:hypothetical protein